MTKNKMFKKTVAIILTVVLLTASIGNTPVVAAGNLAFSVGCDYGANNIDTTPDALKSCDYYAIAGYTSRYTCNPNLTKMRASFNGTRLLESDIIMLSGHGCYYGMSFHSLNQGGEYNFWVTDDPTNSNVTNPITIQNYDMSKVKLIVFSGCGTTSGYYNIARTVYDDGARAALGWNDDIGVQCSYEWLNKFNNCIALGYTIQGAINYANSFNYGDNSCKDYYLYGDGSQILKRTSSTAMSTNLISEEHGISKFVNYVIGIDELVKKDDIEQIIISEYSNYFFDDFEIDISYHNGGRATLTVVEKIGEFFTQNAYVLFYENGKITEIYDRTVNNKSVSTMQAQTLATQTINYREAFSLAAEEIPEEYTIVEQNGKAMFDVETGEKYYMVYTTIRTDEGAKSVFGYKYAL